MTFFYFVGTMLTDQSKPVKERWKEMIQKGLFILVIVCVIALWWFIRNAILYGGDFLGRQASSASAELYARYQYKPSHSKTFQKKGGSMLHMIFYKPSFLEHDWLVTVLYSFVGAFGYNKIYLSTMIIVPYLCCLLVGLILMRNCCQRDFFFWNADGTQTALTGKTKRKWSKLGWFTWANVFALLIPNYLNAYYSYSSDFQPQGRYSMPMLIPLMYFVTKGVQAFLKREKNYRSMKIVLYSGLCGGSGISGIYLGENHLSDVLAELLRIAVSGTEKESGETFGKNFSADSKIKKAVAEEGIGGLAGRTKGYLARAKKKKSFREKIPGLPGYSLYQWLQ